MDSTLFEEWVREINQKFQRKNRKIAMIIDNCPTHPDVPDTSNVTMIRSRERFAKDFNPSWNGAAFFFSGGCVERNSR